MRYQRAKQTAGLWLLFGAVAGIVGLFGFLIARRHVLEAEAARTAEEHAKPVAAPVTQPKAARTQPVADWPAGKAAGGEGWLAEVEAEYAATEEARRLGTERFRASLDRMNYGELVSATNCLRSVQSSGLEGFSTMRPEVAAEAAKVAPNLIAAYRRELAIERGELPGRYPLDKRKKLWPEFAAAVGWGEFCLTQKFNDLTAEEIDAALDAARRLKAGGLQNLNKEERRLLLKAGAYPVFAKAVGRSGPTKREGDD